jgi:hypothetical protein
MTTYDWCCLSCGEANARAISECVACRCPVNATLAQLVQHREQFLASGGVLKPGATTLHEPPDVSAGEVAGVTAAVLLSCWPF